MEGEVPGGKLIKAVEIARDSGTYPETVKDNLRRPAEYGYIRALCTRYGLRSLLSNPRSGNIKSQSKETVKKVLSGVDKAQDKVNWQFFRVPDKGFVEVVEYRKTARAQRMAGKAEQHSRY